MFAGITRQWWDEQTSAVDTFPSISRATDSFEPLGQEGEFDSIGYCSRFPRMIAKWPQQRQPVLQRRGITGGLEFEATDNYVWVCVLPTCGAQMCCSLPGL